MKLVEEYLGDPERVNEYTSQMSNFVSGVTQQMDNLPYITDLSDIFDYQEDIFYDTCHVTDKGNRIIMENIYQHIENTIKEFKR